MRECVGAEQGSNLGWEPCESGFGRRAGPPTDKDTGKRGSRWGSGLALHKDFVRASIPRRSGSGQAWKRARRSACLRPSTLQEWIGEGKHTRLGHRLCKNELGKEEDMLRTRAWKEQIGSGNAAKVHLRMQRKTFGTRAFVARLDWL